MVGEAYAILIYIHSSGDFVLSIGYTMRMRGYPIYTTEGKVQGHVYSMTPNPNCISNGFAAA